VLAKVWGEHIGAGGVAEAILRKRREIAVHPCALVGATELQRREHVAAEELALQCIEDAHAGWLVEVQR
jgi:hypothetical protein